MPRPSVLGRGIGGPPAGVLPMVMRLQAAIAISATSVNDYKGYHNATR